MPGTPSESPNLLNHPDQVALCAGRMYWIALVLTDNENVAATLTRKASELLPPRDHAFNPRLENWICRMAIKACIALQRRQLVADQRDRISWEEETQALQLEPLELVNNLSMTSIEHAIRSLPPLPRFMFIMRTLNRFSVQEAAEMMGLPVITCEAAGKYALVSLTREVQSCDLTSWVTTHKFA